MTKDSGRRGDGGRRETEKEREMGGQGAGGRGAGGQGRAPHVSPKTLGRPRCYAKMHGPTNGHPNLL